MKQIFAMLVISSIFSHASHLDNLMNRYKTAAPSQKYEIMNQIKLEIARLQKSRQRQAISKLQHLINNAKHAKTNALDLLNGTSNVKDHNNKTQSGDENSHDSRTGGRDSNEGGHGGGGHR